MHFFEGNTFFKEWIFPHRVGQCALLASVRPQEFQDLHSHYSNLFYWVLFLRLILTLLPWGSSDLIFRSDLIFALPRKRKNKIGSKKIRSLEPQGIFWLRNVTWGLPTVYCSCKDQKKQLSKQAPPQRPDPCRYRRPKPSPKIINTIVCVWKPKQSPTHTDTYTLNLDSRRV